MSEITAQPRYQTIYTNIRKSIRDGLYPTGTMMPTEIDLCTQYGVSRTTVRKAMSMLEQEGFISIRQGRGTEVLDLSTTQNLGNISSITETLKNKGYKVKVDSMSIQAITCPKHLVEPFALQPEDQIFMVERLVLADDIPVAYIRNYVNPKYAPALDQYSGQFVSLYRFLETHYHLALTDADETITAIAADFLDSNLLKIPVGSPLIQSKRMTYSRSMLIDRSESKLVAHRYEYRIHLRGRRHINL